MKQFFRLLGTFVLMQSCTPEAQNKYLTYHNIIILSDLSDRIEPTLNGIIPNQQYPPKDLEKIDEILNFFQDECVKPGQKIGDRSSIIFSTFSNESIAYIDIGEIQELSDKQEFINSTGRYKNNGLRFEVEKFKQKVHNAYNNIQNQGLDLISATMDKIENGTIIKKNLALAVGIDTVFVDFDNHICIFTDGYLEYKNKSSNNQFYFGNPEIEKIRQYCKIKNVDIETALSDNSAWCLPAVTNDLNQFINLYILETHERDKNTNLQTYKNPIGLRDNEILEAVWRKWAIECNFKSFTWKKY